MALTSGNLLSYSLRTVGVLILIVASLVFLYPLVTVALASFRPPSQMFTFPPTLLVKEPTLMNFVNAQNNQNIFLGLANSLIVVVGSVLVTLVVCSTTGYALATMEFRGRDLIFYLVLSTMILPLFTMAVPNFMVLKRLGLINNYLAIILPSGANAIGIFLVRQYMLNLPRDYFEAGIIDGASTFRVWYMVAVPLSKPILIAVLIYTFVTVWIDFFTPLLVLFKPNVRPLSLVIYTMLIAITRIDIPAIISGSVVGFVVPIIIFVIFQRHFVEGISGGIKG
jgi:ABC-type glycerol-3-phosphate transport system permease component